MTKCTLTDEELIEKTRQHSIKAMEYEGLNWATHISTSPNEHPNLLVIELGRRLAEANKKVEQAHQAHEDYLKSLVATGETHVYHHDIVAERAQATARRSELIAEKGLLRWRMELCERRMCWFAYVGCLDDNQPIAEIRWMNDGKERYTLGIMIDGNGALLRGNDFSELKAICEEYYDQHKQEFVPKTTT